MYEKNKNEMDFSQLTICNPYKKCIQFMVMNSNIILLFTLSIILTRGISYYNIEC